MEYNAQNNRLQFTQDEIRRGSDYLLGAIHYFRKSHGLPPEGAKDMPFPDKADTCEYCIISAAKALGIDLGSERPGELDVRKYS